MAVDLGSTFRGFESYHKQILFGMRWQKMILKRYRMASWLLVAGFDSRTSHHLQSGIAQW
jgi:hypothetical protein